MSEQSIHDMAYRGKTENVKHLLSENDELKTAEDRVSIFSFNYSLRLCCYSKIYSFRTVEC